MSDERTAAEQRLVDLTEDEIKAMPEDEALALLDAYIEGMSIREVKERMLQHHQGFKSVDVILMNMLNRINTLEQVVNVLMQQSLAARVGAPAAPIAPSDGVVPPHPGGGYL